ncbi:hypothetical protein [Corynebacterium liangguodongii]|uniref:Uncharacterized protein n=1 Tax=Corynebacterium liangguodongii TaxID=2079535 RepID=A0A2S0WBZ4_9CORY|nr:hypothetical protein [Corynebacterium liangguodongii]AWB83202.1 hypothetical protein C3E79_00820 [Corynebacterium liangguodongii]PWB98797.1 hypothetical protein DF219_10280 [Corynebacterium liangguodongii]
MTFSDRARLRTAAAALALTAAVAAPAAPPVSAQPSATGTAAPSTPVDPARFEETDHGLELGIAPGETIVLEPTEAHPLTYRITEGEDSTLPAGWSVLTSPKGLRITAPLTAPEGDYAAVSVRTDGGEERDLRVTIERSEPAELKAAAPGSAAPAGSSSWIGDLIGRVATFLSA